MHLSESTTFDSRSWYVVHCQRLKEWSAAMAIETRLGLTVFLPEVRRRFRGRIQHTPFFPCYLFVHADIHDIGISKINATPGVVRLVAFDNQAQPVPRAVIDHIRSRVSDIDAHGGLATHNFRPGDTVRLKVGPFQGLEAAFLGPQKPSERVRVLIDFLGSLREANVSVDDLERVGTAPAPRQERRTRGRGRPIRQL